MADDKNQEKKEEKKIIVDEDWKEQAKREKEIMSAKEEAEKKKAEKQKPHRHGPLPKGDFAALLSMLATQALFALGIIKIEEQENKEPNFELAKYNIDMLEALEEKTKGNLTEQEQKVLSETLNQIRMAYVQLSGQ